MISSAGFGTHFEGDSVVGVAKGRNQTLITLANPVSQFVFIRRSENKTGMATVETLDKLELEIPELSKIMTSILFDNGIEFSKFDDMMKSVKNKEEKRFQIYFTHPYALHRLQRRQNHGERHPFGFRPALRTLRRG